MFLFHSNLMLLGLFVVVFFFFVVVVVVLFFASLIDIKYSSYFHISLILN